MQKTKNKINTESIYLLADKNSSELVLDYNVADGSVTHYSERVTQIFGLPLILEHAQDYLLRYGVIQPESAHEFLHIFKRIDEGEPHVEGVVKARDAKGNQLWIQMVLTTYFKPDKTPLHAVGILKDITQQRIAQLQCADEENLRNILMREALLYYEADLISRKVLFGKESLQKALGTFTSDNYDEIFALLVENVVYPDEREAVRSAFSSEKLLNFFSQGEKRIELEYRRLTGSGSVIWVKDVIYLAENPLTNHIILYAYVNDINDRKKQEQSLRESAQVDPLTGLYNKITIEKKIQEALESSAAKGNSSAVLFIYLQNFSTINEKLGFYFGDALLAELGHLLKNFCSTDDIAGRLGGTTFLMYLNHADSKEKLCEKVDALRRILSLNRAESLVSLDYHISLGTGYTPELGCSYDKLLHHASIISAKQTEPFRPDVTFDENVFAYIFKVLYKSSDLSAAITGVLEFVIKHYGFSRGCMYEISPDNNYHCTFEWTDPETGHILEKYHVLSQSQIFYLMENLGSDNMRIFHPDDIFPDDPAYGSLRMRLLYVFMISGSPKGFVCFDSYGKIDDYHLLQDKSIIQSIAHILDVFQSGKNVNNELWENSVLLQHIVDGFKSCTYIIDPDTYILKYINQNTRQNISEALPGTLCYETIRGRTKPCDDCPISRMTKEGILTDRCEMYLDKYNVWAQINASLITLPSGKIYGAFSGFDFSDHKKGDTINLEGLSAFTQDTSLYDALAVSTDDYIFMCDMSTQLFYFPKKMVEEFDLPGQIVEDAVQVWGRLVHEEDRAAFLAELNLMFSGGTDTHSMEYRVMNREGVWVWIRARGHIERDINDNPTMFAGVLTNLGNKNTKIDHITGLPDKYEFEVRTRALLAGDVTQGVLLVLGLDNFRYINNLYGWDFGDKVLKESAQRLLSTLQEKVQLYKLDGDKFGLFFPEMDIEVVKEYYRSLGRIFKQNRQLEDQRYFCTISGGCACLVQADMSFSALFKQANLALDFSKREGKNRLTIFDEETMSENDRILALLSLLHESVDNGCKGFELYYQPQTDPKTRDINSAEALLRWHAPDKTLVSPGVFIPLLEQSGLIQKVGQWVIEEAAATCREWRNLNPAFTISVNLSYIQLQDQAFLPYLVRKINEGYIDPSMLHLEITESCIANGSHSLISAFGSLRSMGFAIEMDDFGTGYSSLEILKNAPADIVKIDHSFVRNITHSNFDSTFIQFIVTLCHSVDIRVCLEGVETWDEFYLVEPMGLDLIQGFLFGRPQKRTEFETHYLTADKNVT